jgi:hypothetical protein
MSMRIASTILLAALAGCSAGNAPGSEDTQAGGKGSGASGGSTPMGKGGSSNPSGGSGGSTSAGAGSGTTSGTGGSAGMPNQIPDGVGIGAITQCTDRTIVGPTPVRRLSRLEYFNSVRDLFGVEVNQGDLPSDELLGVFTTNVRTRMTADQFTRYDTLAKAVGEEVAANLPAASGCSGSEAACVQSYLVGKARQAFHGVLEEADRQALVDLHNAVLADDAALAAATAVRFILESPRFLYAVEFGTPEGNVARLSQGEVAGRLASFLWRSVPDQALLDAADANGLASADGLRQQATRMVADEKAQPVLRSFVNEWLGLNPPNPGAPALDAAISAEAGDVFVSAAQGSGTYPELLTSTTTRGGNELAQFYGGTAAGDGSLTLPAERQGLLLRAAFLRSHVKGDRPSPTQRGLQLRQALLCDPVAFPADNVNMNIPPPMNGQSENDVFNQHGSDPKCVGCHGAMDPIGFAFGQYGSDGVYNPALATSTAGEIRPGNVNDLEAEFENVAELINILAANENPQQCFVIQMNRFALGRTESSADACGLSDIWASVKDTQSLKTLLIETAASYLMQNRNIVRAGEACQ